MKNKLFIGLMSAFILLSGSVVAIAAKNKDLPLDQRGTSQSKSQFHDKVDDSKNRLSSKHNDDGVNHDQNDDSKSLQVGGRNDDGVNHDQDDDSKNRTETNKHQRHDAGADHDKNDDSK